MLNIGDKVIFTDNRIRPRYLQGARGVITALDKTVWGGFYAETPYQTYEIEITHVRSCGSRDRFRIGTKAVRVDERLIARDFS